MSDGPTPNDDHTRIVAKAAGAAAARELLLMLGVDVSTPAGIVRAQRNFAFLDDLHTGTKLVKRRVILGVVGAVITTVLAWMALGFRSTFH